MNNQINKKVDFILCLFLGYLGVHKFYEKKTSVGILYLFTIGLFLLGWVYDCIKLGIELYKSKNIVNIYENSLNSVAPSTPKFTPLKEHFVTIAHPDGKIEQAPDNVILDTDSHVLVCDGGHTYHKCTGCFKKWSNTYQENFKGWKLISLEEAKQQGLTLCSFCEEALNFSIDNLLENDKDTE